VPEEIAEEGTQLAEQAPEPIPPQIPTELPTPELRIVEGEERCSIEDEEEDETPEFLQRHYATYLVRVRTEIEQMVETLNLKEAIFEERLQKLYGVATIEELDQLDLENLHSRLQATIQKEAQ